jgi:protein SCO1/2/putative membrane protein
VDVPEWVTMLPAVNASLNGLATVMLVRGWLLIHRGQRDTDRRDAHRRTMLATFGVSVAFLICYLVYHRALQIYTGSGSRKFVGPDAVRAVYLVILVTHVVLAASVPFLAGITIWRGLKADKAEKLGQPVDWGPHRKIAKITFPIWLYVSVTGVVIYFMVYHWPVG